MSASRPALVGAVFPDRHSAAEAASDLRAAGFDDEELTTAEWSADDQYVIASHAGRRIWKSLLIGAALGAVVGAAGGAIAAATFWDALSDPLALGIGAATGTTAGGFWGAYVGLNRYRSQLWDQQDWEHLDLEEGQVLIVMAADEQPEVAAEILQRHGGRRVEPVHPQ